MTRNVQAQSKWLATIVIGSAAVLLFIPGTAWAGSGHDDYDRHRDHDRNESRSDHDRYESNSDHNRYASHYTHDRRDFHKRHRHASHKRHHYNSHRRHHQHAKRRGHEKHHFGYYCRPCNRSFSARDALYDHVAYRHDVPFRQLSVAVSFGGFGWIFFG